MVLALSKAANRAKVELLRQCALCALDDFDSDSRVIHEDGSTFFVCNSFTRVWVDPVDTKVWIFLFAEHSEPMYWCSEDLYSWGSYKRIPAPECGGII